VPRSSPDTRPSHGGAVLLTGATGFLGMELLARYLERSDRTIFALVRGRDQNEASARLRAAARRVCRDSDAHNGRLVAVPADLEGEDMGIDSRLRDELAEHTSEIVHAAASVSFTLPLEQARRINVDGTRKVIDFAERCNKRGNLNRVSYVSTAYVAGTHHGRFAEDELDLGQDFRNTYEQTKWEAERLVHAHSGSLPVQVFRPSIVVGEHDTGWTASFNVIYAPLKAFARGVYPLVPGRRSAPVDVVPVSYVADAMFELAGRPDAEGQTYHLAAGPQASTVGELIDMSARRFRRRRALALPPRLYRRFVHPLLLRRSKGQRHEWLQRSESFFPYFEMDISYDTRKTRAALEPAGIRVPPLRDYFERLVGYALAADWGKRPLSRAEAASTVTSVRSQPAKGSEKQHRRARPSRSRSSIDELTDL
jgi:thioester reductase-like protein